MEEQILDQASELNADYLEQIINSKTTFYIDIECIIDYRITALLCLMTEEEYVYIQIGLFKYNTTYNPSTMNSFPNVSVTDEMIDEFLGRIKDGTASELEKLRFAQRLQRYDYYDTFLDYVRASKNQSRLAEVPDKITIVIGKNDKPVHSFLTDNLIRGFRSAVGECEVIVTDLPLEEMPDPEVLSFSHFSIRDFEKFINFDNVSRLVASKDILGVSIHTYPFITRENKTLTQRQMLINMEQAMNVLFDFKYVNMRIRTNE